MPASQAGRRRFESGRPLHFFDEGLRETQPVAPLDFSESGGQSPGDERRRTEIDLVSAGRRPPVPWASPLRETAVHEEKPVLDHLAILRQQRHIADLDELSIAIPPSRSWRNPTARATQTPPAAGGRACGEPPRNRRRAPGGGRSRRIPPPPPARAAPPPIPPAASRRMPRARPAATCWPWLT